MVNVIHWGERGKRPAPVPAPPRRQGIPSLGQSVEPDALGHAIEVTHHQVKRPPRLLRAPTQPGHILQERCSPEKRMTLAIHHQQTDHATRFDLCLDSERHSTPERDAIENPQRLPRADRQLVPITSPRLVLGLDPRSGRSQVGHQHIEPVVGRGLAQNHDVARLRGDRPADRRPPRRAPVPTSPPDHIPVEYPDRGRGGGRIRIRGHGRPTPTDQGDRPTNQGRQPDQYQAKSPTTGRSPSSPADQVKTNGGQPEQGEGQIHQDRPGRRPVADDLPNCPQGDQGQEPEADTAPANPAESRPRHCGSLDSSVNGRAREVRRRKCGRG